MPRLFTPVTIRTRPCHTQLPSYIQDMVDQAVSLSDDERLQLLMTLLSSYKELLPVSGNAITGRTSSVLHDIDTGDTKPIRHTPRRLSSQKIKGQDKLVDQMLTIVSGCYLLFLFLSATIP